MEITRPSLTRIARKAGIKCIANDCYPMMRALINQELERVLDKILIVNATKQNKMISCDDVYDTLSLLDINLAKSDFLGTSVLNK
jgi:histone H3/H4